MIGSVVSVCGDLPKSLPHRADSRGPWLHVEPRNASPLESTPFTRRFRPKARQLIAQNRLSWPAWCTPRLQPGPGGEAQSWHKEKFTVETAPTIAATGEPEVDAHKPIVAAPVPGTSRGMDLRLSANPPDHRQTVVNRRASVQRRTA